jgi:hypothetical protein
MSTIVFPQRFACRRDTAANWTSVNPVLWVGEVGFQIDTGLPMRMKVGTGTDAWNDLPYFAAGTTWHNGTGVPSGGLGDDGDYYLRTSTGAIYVKATGTWSMVFSGSGSLGTGAVGATFDGGGAVLTAGVYVDVLVPFNCTIDAATVVANQTGSIELSVLADPYASFPPTTDIAPNPPEIVSADKSRDTTLTGWTVALTAGTVVRFGIVSCSAIQRATLTLEVTKT